MKLELLSFRLEVKNLGQFEQDRPRKPSNSVPIDWRMGSMATYGPLFLYLFSQARNFRSSKSS
jgi:hypothetical protein